MSERASTPSSFFSGSSRFFVLSLSLFPDLLGEDGEARVLRGVDSLASFGLSCDGDVGIEPATVEALLCDCGRCLFSASLFSNVPRSVRPLSSSLRRPGFCVSDSHSSKGTLFDPAWSHGNSGTYQTT